ncbi:MAG TPA: M23 family metallopeptidase [Actinomycetota bacterium]|nr:M23 family metallopeptidase [Actinomycetota bacterium]
MRRLARALPAATLLMATILQASPAPAQMLDPCRPVPIPGLCQPAPLPTTPPAPDPDERDDPRERPKRQKRKGSEPGRPSPGRAASTASAGHSAHQAPFAISSPNSTARLMDLLSSLVPEGTPLQDSLTQVVGPFPVAGPAWWIDDWHAPRSGGRVHLGLDIFAPHGTPLVAAATGVVTQKGRGAMPGLYVEITDADGTQFFYCHLSRWAADVEIGQRVEVGDVLGFVGNTGNAISTPPHVHFEIQPGGHPQPPKPWVDRWVRLAEQRALILIRRLGGELPSDEAAAFRLTRLFDLAVEGSDPDALGHVLALAAMQPNVSSLEMAGSAAGQMAWEIDWREPAEPAPPWGVPALPWQVSGVPRPDDHPPGDGSD